MVMQGLKNLDHIAYIRFASVYRDFTDITILKKEIDTLVNDKAEVPHPSSQLPLLPVDELKGIDKKSQRNRK